MAIDLFCVNSIIIFFFVDVRFNCVFTNLIEKIKEGISLDTPL